jgi:hypothetical protein
MFNFNLRRLLLGSTLLPQGRSLVVGRLNAKPIGLDSKFMLVQPHLAVQMQRDAKRYQGTVRFDPRELVASEEEQCCDVWLPDLSGSMAEANKLADAKVGCKAALRMRVGRGNKFCIIGYNEMAIFVFPKDGKPCEDTPENVELACSAIDRMQASGDTYFSRGINAAVQAFLRSGCRRGAALLITDGINYRDDNEGFFGFGGLPSALARVRKLNLMGDRTFTIQPVAVGPEAARGLEQLQAITDACLGPPPCYIQPGTGPGPWRDMLLAFISALEAPRLHDVTLRFSELKPNVKFVAVRIACSFLTAGSKRPSPSPPQDLTPFLTSGNDGGTAEVHMGGWTEEARVVLFQMDVQLPREADGIELGKLEVSFQVGRQVYVIEPMAMTAHCTSVRDLSFLVNQATAEAIGTLQVHDAWRQGSIAVSQAKMEAARDFFQAAYDAALALGADGELYIMNMKTFLEISGEGKVAIKAGVSAGNSVIMNSSLAQVAPAAVAKTIG